MHANLSPFSTSRFPSMTVSLKLFFNTNPTNKHQYLLRSSCRLLLACITSALWATRGKHGISRECFSPSLASRFALVMYEMSCSPRLALKTTVMEATFYTLNELFHSALPSEYDEYVPPTRLTNCVVTTLRTWIQRRFPQPEDTCSHYYTHWRTQTQRCHHRLIHTYSSCCRIQPSPSLNIIYFSQTHSHSIFLPTLCYCVLICTSRSLQKY